MVNRYVCTVLDEMRDQLKNLNKTTLKRFKKYHKHMIEEAQTLVNRMEAALYYVRDEKYLHKEVKSLKKEVEDLKLQKEALKQDVDTIEPAAEESDIVSSHNDEVSAPTIEELYRIVDRHRVSIHELYEHE